MGETGDRFRYKTAVEASVKVSNTRNFCRIWALFDCFSWIVTPVKVTIP